ncbi:sulfatase-like hydrolase/transferase [candidate division KSB1 bacterium]|nr:sulfatase-like hydrolase/transferase [candidate division KSB1 bacterium]
MNSSDKPNIILIMADDLGYECLGCYGSESYKTPHLDRLADTGMRFNHCYSQPLCTPSRVQLMTGRYNFRNYKMFGYLDPNEITFGHILRDAGYKTCIAGKWQLSNGIEGPFHAGFDEYCLWQIYTAIARKDARGSRYADPKIYQNGALLENTRGSYGPDVFCDYVLDFMERNKNKPFLVYYPMVLTHSPFVPTPESADWSNNKHESDVRYFADMVAYMDKMVGRIAHKLDQLKLRQKTLILFIGDNGTPQEIRSRFGGRWIQGGKRLMTDAGTHVPLIANWQGVIPGNQVSEDLIDFSDFVPTLAECAGANLPENWTIDGQSFYPLLCGKQASPREWVFMHYWGRGRNIFETRRCARDKRYKLYDNAAFFDLRQDPLEQHPLEADAITGELKHIKERLQTVLDRMK